MDHVKDEGTAAKRSEPRRLEKLFKVLVVGGAVLATAYASASAIHGSTGSADRGGDDGGSPGW